MNYIGRVFSEVGLAVRIYKFPIMGFELLSPPVLELVAPEIDALEAAPFIYSGSTPDEGIEEYLHYTDKTKVAGFLEWEKYTVVDDSGEACGYLVARPNGPAIAMPGPPAGLGTVQGGAYYNWPAFVIGQTDLQPIQEYYEERKAPENPLPC